MSSRPRFGLISAVFLAAGSVSAGTQGFAFLAAPPAAAPAGMAGAAVAEPAVPWAAFYNPAALAGLESSSLSFHGYSMWGDAHHESVSHARPARWGGWSATGGVFGVRDLVKTYYDPASPDRFVESGDLEAGSQYVGAAFGRPAGRSFAWGAGATLVKEDLDTESSVTLLADAGLQGLVDEKYRWGLSFLGAGPGARGSAAPFRLQAGVGYAPEPWVSWEVDLLHPLHGTDAIMIGGRFTWEESAFLRLGYRHRLKEQNMDNLSGASAGLGGIWGNFSADYAFQPFAEFGGTHLISLNWSWGEEAARRGPASRHRRFVR